jgi:cellulose synthase/poly-beta-1,6-N-acetylglucosamine synthase-like glycosyltransferase
VVPRIYRRVEPLSRTIQSLLNLDYPDYEIVVVENRVGEDHEPIPPFSDDGRVTIVVERTRSVGSPAIAG